MNIAIDESPIRESGHKVRGIGFYLTHLKNALLTYFPQHSYQFFSESDGIPAQADIIHYPYFEPFFLTLPMRKKKKTVVTVHDLTPLVFPNQFPAGIKGKVKWVLQRQRLRNIDVVITDSITSKNDIVRLAGVKKEKIHVVYLAAGEEFKRLPDGPWKDETRKKYQLPAEFALYVGDVTWNKNLPRLLRSVANTDIPLVLVGKSIPAKISDPNNPWNKDHITTQKLIKENNNIKAVGFVSSEDLVKLYNLATVFVFPSLYEGFGLPVLEAMQCGCPVVTTHEGSLKEVAANAALIVEAYEEQSIQEGIKKVLGDKHLQEDLSTRGRVQVKKFSWEATAQQTLNAYES